MIPINEGDVVVVAALDDIPEHLFRVEEVFEDHLTGIALDGPLEGAYGEPEIHQVHSQGTS
jgi:hypothetical protein